MEEAMKLALEALDNLMYWDNGKSDYDEARKAIKALEEALANHCEDNLDMVKQERPDGGIGGCATCGAVYADQIIKQEQGAPVAWMKEQWSPDCGTYFEIYRDDEMGWRDPTDWTPLYTAPPAAQPCPTCEALARAVMMDQTAHDTQRTWAGLTDEDLAVCGDENDVMLARYWERVCKDKNT
jgi:hypothetical protein